MVSLEPVMTAKEQAAGVPQSVWHATKRGSDGEADETILKRLVEAHFRHTGSFRAKEILTDWQNARGRFTKVFPTEYRRARLGRRRAGASGPGPPA